MFRSFKRHAGQAILLSLVIAVTSCSTFQPPDANGPRANVRPYPIAVTTDESEPVGLLAWKNLAKLYGVTSQEEPRFNPLTGTLEALPPDAVGRITLPRVGAEATQSEEDVRESLRRFINDWREVIGVEPSQLSLVERVDEQSGLKAAHYKQHPFRNELRGSFGDLTIKFRSDRRIVELSSNCIPHADRLQASLSAQSPKVTAEDAATHVAGDQIPVIDANGAHQTLTLPSGTPLEVRQLVVYALPGLDQQSLELHLAWEIGVSNAAIKTIYLDAITDEVIIGN